MLLAWVDRRRTSRVRQKLFRSVKKDGQIASTWSNSTSRRRRSSRIQNLRVNVSFRIYVFSALVNSDMAELLAKKKWCKRRDISIVWIHTLLTPSYAFEQFKVILEENTLILHCKTTCCYSATSPSTSTTFEAPTICTRSFNKGLILGGKDVKKGRHAMFFTDLIEQHRERNYDVTKHRIAVYKHNWQVHQNTVYWCNLRVAQSKGLQFHQTRSNAIIPYNTSPAVQKVKRRIVQQKKRISLLLYRKRIVLKWNLHYARQDTTSCDARTSLDHSSKHRETCAPFDRPRPRWHQQGSGPKFDSSVRDASKSRSVASRPEAKSRVQPIQRAVEGNDLQHGKHGVLRDLRNHFQKYSATTVWHTGRKALYTILAEHACDLQI